MGYEYQIENLGGELEKRIRLCQSRMAQPDYAPNHVFKPSEYQWYGDWEGRTLLAMERLLPFFGYRPQNYVGFMKELDAHLNAEGYFGPMIGEGGDLNEQQLAGNSWYLRALCVAYENRAEPRTLERIRRVVENLYLKHQDEIADYPVDVDGSENGNYTAGSLTKKIGSWRLSSDSGCIYISLDGLSHAYEITRDERLKQLIELLLSFFVRTDFSKKHFQTHAFLSGVRGAIRFFESTGNEKAFGLAEKYFDYYLTTSLNYVYENYGVLNKACGSEGCAVVDEAMLCATFYRLTGKEKYLALYRKIFVNAIKVAQRSNGGFGCDVGVGTEGGDYFASVPEFAEANWCCTMRGCEGISDFAKNLYFVDGGTVTAGLLNDSRVKLFQGKVEIEERTDYPFDGQTIFRIVKCDQPFCLKIDLFDGYTVENGKTEYRIDRPCEIVIKQKCSVRIRNADGKKGYEYGDMVMGEAIMKNEKSYAIDNRTLQPLVALDKIPMEDVLKIRQRLLY